MGSAYPDQNKERDDWILAKREGVERVTRNNLDPQLPYGFLVEDERSALGEIVRTATIFLTNRECPWRCLMCDLWINTLAEAVPQGAIPAQIGYALTRLGRARQIKLYNNGSFFDRQAIPVADYETIAAQLHSFERLIVESHPALVGDDCLRFRDLLNGQLEIAMGLETVHPVIAPQLNKRMTLDQFASAATRLRLNDIALRVFILVKPPFLDEVEAFHWAARSIDFAFDCEASVVVLIPTRPGNGALDALSKSGDFSPPRLATLERASAYGVRLGRGRVFADLWDLERFASCTICFSARASRLREMNLRQEILTPIRCQNCGGDIE